MKKHRFSILLLILLVISNCIPVSASAATFYYKDGKKHYITKRNLSYNGIAQNLTDTPAFVIDGYNYIPAMKLPEFIDELSCSYNQSLSELTITYKDNVLVMKKDTYSGKLNNTNITMTSTLKLISFTKDGEKHAYLPAKLICDYLGLDYSYSNKNKEIKIASGDGESIIDDSFNPTFTLARPAEIEKGSITCLDDYHNKRLVITMKGNQTNFYKNNAPVMPSGVTFTTQYDQTSNQTKLIFSTQTIQGWKVKEDNQTIYIMHGIPSKMFKNIIVLDPGHGGSDPGACYGTTYKEKDFNLKIVLTALEHFKGNEDYKVYSTRISDTLPTEIKNVWDRRTYAENLNADIFVSVHINSYNTTSTGTETIYNSNRNVSNAGGLNSYTLASIVQSFVQKATGFKNRGVKVDTSLSVLLSSKYPATLTEFGFISNPTEAKTMSQNLDKYGKAIYDAIIDASTKYPLNR